MMLKICAVHDGKAEAFMTPQFFQAAGQAIRSFQDACNDMETGFGKHPEDYSLMELGMWDPRSGEIDLLPAPLVLASGVNMKRSYDPAQIDLMTKEQLQ